jgi:hypothetical protein
VTRVQFVLGFPGGGRWRGLDERKAARLFVQGRVYCGVVCVCTKEDLRFAGRNSCSHELAAEIDILGFKGRWSYKGQVHYQHPALCQTPPKHCGRWSCLYLNSPPSSPPELSPALPSFSAAPHPIYPATPTKIVGRWFSEQHALAGATLRVAFTAPFPILLKIALQSNVGKGSSNI